MSRVITVTIIAIYVFLALYNVYNVTHKKTDVK